MDGHSVGNRQRVILFTETRGCGTAGRTRGVIILHLRATSNEFLYKRLDLPCIIYAGINFPSWLYLLCKFSCVCLWVRPWFSTSGYSILRKHPTGHHAYETSVWLTGSRSYPSSLVNYIPGTAASYGSPLRVRYAGMWNPVGKQGRKHSHSLGVPPQKLKHNLGGNQVALGLRGPPCLHILRVGQA